ncbi:MAG: endolytic transglycosylase MltG [Anaerolineae bacterium]|nr:endolytic transglycosylase MltG [Anaerolineae bacterium]
MSEAPRFSARAFVFVGLLISGLLCIAFLGVVLAAAASTPHLNPIESLVLRLRLAFRSAELNRPLGTDSSVVCFTVARGADAASIAQQLVAQGFALDPELFRAYVRYFNIDSRLQAGTFSLPRSLTLAQLAERLTDANANTIVFRVLEGWRIEEIAAAIDRTRGLTFTGAEFMALVGAGAGSQSGEIGAFAARVGVPVGRSLEGFLFPDTYILPVCGTARDLVERMLANFDTRVTPQMRAAALANGLTLYEAITLASIVQREAVFDDERARIAGVYLNRLLNSRRTPPNPNIPTTLDADPTIQYAIGNTRNPETWWTRLTPEDYRSVQSPYNTYLHKGLPPTPICSPGLASIVAVIYPERTDFAYFRACPNSGGRHTFSRTLAEHANACN